MDLEEARAWINGERSMCNIIPQYPFETWQERVAIADAAMVQQALYVLQAHLLESAPRAMTLREMLAIHAPKEPTFEFEVVMPSPRPKPILFEGRITNLEPIEKYDKERAKQKLIQWPWVWADSVIAAGDKFRDGGD